MIGTTEWLECKEKAMGISNNYWRDYWSNIGGNYWIIGLVHKNSGKD